MTLFDDIQAEIHTQLPAAVGTRPEINLGYGRDAWCVTSVTDDLREVDPDSPLGIAQLGFRAMLSPRDTVPDAPGRGLGVKRWVSKGVTFDQLRAYSGMVKGEWEQDDRIDEVEVDTKLAGARAVPALTFHIRVTPKRLDLQPFALIVTVPAEGAAFLEMLRR